MSKETPGHWVLKSRLKVRQLLLLSSLGESGNLRRSAAELGMTQPAATKLLHQLESALDVELFERSRRGMTPTIFGHAMIRRARLLLTDLNGARDEISALSVGSLGSLRIGTNNSTASELVPRAVSALIQRHPAVGLSLVEGNNDTLMPMLKRGELDLVIGRVMGGAAMDDVDLRILYEDQFLVVCSPRHPLARRRKVTLSDLAQQRWILPKSTAPLCQRLDFLFAQHCGERPRNAVESTSMLTNLALLQESDMVTALPATVVRQYAKSGLVHALPVALPGLVGPVALITRAGRPNSPVAEAFIGELLMAAGKADSALAPAAAARLTVPPGLLP